jgi:predicted GNAT superfamily acetyltransferase
MEVRELTTKNEFERCVELQRTEWGWGDLDIVPVRSFVVTANTGGVTLGALVEDRVIGFINTMPALRDGAPYWYSRMLGIDRKYRSRGVGTLLKRTQREFGLKRGIRLIEWTFDPLESKNAHLNLEKLGVIIRRYYVNHYGYTSSHLQRSMESDRLVAEWWLEKKRPVIVGERRRVRVPSDIQLVKDRSVDEAVEIQLRVRAEFEQHFADDYMVVGFERLDNDQSEYVLSSAEGTEYANRES